MKLSSVAPVGLLLVGLSSAQDPSSTSSVFSAPTSSPAPDINSTAYDLSQHYCRIWRHSSVLADGKIYIDGGNLYLPTNGRTFYDTESGTWTKGMHNHFLELDLTRNFSNQDSSPFRRILKASDVPTALIENALWYSRATGKVYQLGGWFSSNNPADLGFTRTEHLPSSAIWEFDPPTERWALAESGFELKGTGPKVERPGAAAYCDAPSLNMSFIFEGYVQQRSDRAYASYASNSDFKFLGGMLALDTNTDKAKPTLRNISVPVSLDGGKSPFGPRMNGAMVHVPVGDKGVLVQIGGQTANEATPYGVRVAGANGKNRNIDLGFVDLYDIVSGFWFRQRTFGLPGIPSGRSDVCAVVVPALDKSSFNIYMVAGMENYATGIATQQIWVLSLPSFQWILVHTREGGLYGHTCHAVGENLLIIGGMNTKPEGGDVQNCAAHMPAEIFSLAENNYTGVYDADGATRHPPVPSQIVSAVGGTASGGAHVRGPPVWDDLYLQFVFNTALSRPQYSPTYTLVAGFDSGATETPPPEGADNQPNQSGRPKGGGGGGGGNQGAIIGGVVGGIMGALLIAGFVAGFCILSRRRVTQADLDALEAAGPDGGPAPRELDFNTQQSELPAYSESKVWYTNPHQQQPQEMVVPAFINNASYHSMAVPVPQTAPAEMPATPGLVLVHPVAPDQDAAVLSPASPDPSPRHHAHFSVSTATMSPQSRSGFDSPGRGQQGADSRVVSGMSPELSGWATFPANTGGGHPVPARQSQGPAPILYI